MPHHRTVPRLVAPVAVLTLALTACGSADDGTDAERAAAPATSAPPSPSASAGGAMARGESATGKVDEVTYAVVAQRVDVGTRAQAAKAVADAADAEGRVPVVAHVAYTHKGGPDLTDGSGVRDRTAVFADGRRGAVLAGASEAAPGCEDPYGVGSWERGGRHVFCVTYLVPADATSVEVHWSPEGGEPYVWSFPGPDQQRGRG
ncbi:hypothetical protein H0H10_34305 [Streptomyces sp. TRM S81-3]|uniref:Lipoprotein n=1 Tax=Streptomyces griseicoloratus TaxID=2752516 RepID=A0A926QUP3_9ACTN|nr:hypothetical protein [Streptomyces griseicoloratus]MBD0424180.1 hypothetical protein [Streptomyces griseicoloratus]